MEIGNDYHEGEHQEGEYHSAADLDETWQSAGRPDDGLTQTRFRHRPAEADEAGGTGLEQRSPRLGMQVSRPPASEVPLDSYCAPSG